MDQDKSYRHASGDTDGSCDACIYWGAWQDGPDHDARMRALIAERARIGDTWTVERGEPSRAYPSGARHLYQWVPKVERDSLDDPAD